MTTTIAFATTARLPEHRPDRLDALHRTMAQVLTEWPTHVCRSCAGTGGVWSLERRAAVACSCVLARIGVNSPSLDLAAD